MKYNTLAELKAAYDQGQLTQADTVTVDNDGVTLYLCDPDDEFGENAQMVFYYEDLPRYLLVEALEMLGIPAEQA